MSNKNYWTTAIVVFVLYMVWRWVSSALPFIGAEEPIYTSFGYYLGGLAFALLWTYVYSKGYENSGVAEGFRYGIYLGLLYYLPAFFTSWKAGTFGGEFMTMFWALVGYAIYGLGAAMTYKTETTPTV